MEIAEAARSLARAQEAALLACIARGRQTSDLFTVVEFGSGCLAQLLAEREEVEEIVLVRCSSRQSADTLPARTSLWSNSCTKPSQMMTLLRVVQNSGRSRVAIAAADCAAGQQLRLLQLVKALQLPEVLLVLATEPPMSTDRSVQKSVFCAGTKLLTMPMLPKEVSGRHRAWQAFLMDGLRACGALVGEDGTGTMVIAQRAAEERLSSMSSGKDPKADTSEHFPPVILGVTEQLGALRAEIDASVARLPIFPLCNGLVNARLVKSTADRYTAADDKGRSYSSLHYVPQAPSSHASIYELEIVPSDAVAASDDEVDAMKGSTPTIPTGKATLIGYIALQAYGVDQPEKQFPSTVPYRTMHAVNVERLVVVPEWRGSGAKEALLAACAPYAARGYPVRIKTGSEAVHESFLRCSLLAYEGHRPPGTTACGVRRPMKRYARVLTAEGGIASEASRGRPLYGVHASQDRTRDFEGNWRRMDGAEAREVQDVSSDSGASTSTVRGAGTAAQPPSSRMLRERTPPRRDDADATSPSAPPIHTRGSSQEDSCSAYVDPSLPQPSTARTAAAKSQRTLMNKLTADSFEKIVPQLAVAATATAKDLHTTLHLLFARASREPLFCGLYASAAARILEACPSASDFAAAAEGQVCAVLEACAGPEYAKGSGRLVAELFRRKVLSLDALANATRLRDLLLHGSAGRLCAFTAVAGFDLRRGSREDLLDVLIRVVAAVAAADGQSVPRAACSAVLELHRLGWPVEREESSSTGLRTLDEVRQEAAEDLGLVLAPCNAKADSLRGLREGWVHWYVGEAILHPETAEAYAFDETVGRILPVLPVPVASSAAGNARAEVIGGSVSCEPRHREAVV